MNINFLCVCLTAIFTGWAVYQSCTKYRHVMGGCLVIDAVCVGGFILSLWLTGTLT